MVLRKSKLERVTQREAYNIDVNCSDLTDVEDPVLMNCPNSTSLSTDVGQPDAVFDWSAVTASDNSGAATVTSNYASGASFPVGTTEVTFVATDPSGNTATCSINVTVTGIV